MENSLDSLDLKPLDLSLHSLDLKPEIQILGSVAEDGDHIIP